VQKSYEAGCFLGIHFQHLAFVFELNAQLPFPVLGAAGKSHCCLGISGWGCDF